MSGINNITVGVDKPGEDLSVFEKKENKGVAGGYVPLNEFQKIASQYLNIVNDLVTGGADSLLSAEQGKQVQLQLDAISSILFSDNVNLDTIQEIVNAIENTQTYLETILVNDLTTGGTTKALTAEMGKSLKALIDNLTLSISGKEDISNKSQDIEADKASATKYGSVKAFYDWALGKFKTYILGIETTAAISYTLNLPNINKRTVFTGTNPVALTVPTNAAVAIPIGTQKEFTVQGAGTATVSGVGITFVQKNLVFTTGETFHLTKIDTDVWAVEGSNDPNLLHKTGDESKTGLLSFTRTINTISGIILNNSSDKRIMDMVNSSSGVGAYCENSSSGEGFRCNNFSNGSGFYSYNSSINGKGFYSYNTSTGAGIYSTNLGAGFGMYSVNTSSGDGLQLQNQSTGRGIVIDNTLIATGLPFSILKKGFEKFSISDSGVISIKDLNTVPVSAVDIGKKGEIRFTDTHIYVCIANNTWVRTALTTW